MKYYFSQCNEITLYNTRGFWLSETQARLAAASLAYVTDDTYGIVKVGVITNYLGGVCIKLDQYFTPSECALIRAFSDWVAGEPSPEGDVRSSFVASNLNLGRVCCFKMVWKKKRWEDS